MKTRRQILADYLGVEENFVEDAENYFSLGEQFWISKWNNDFDNPYETEYTVLTKQETRKVLKQKIAEHFEEDNISDFYEEYLYKILREYINKDKLIEDYQKQYRKVINNFELEKEEKEQYEIIANKISQTLDIDNVVITIINYTGNVREAFKYFKNYIIIDKVVDDLMEQGDFAYFLAYYDQTIREVKDGKTTYYLFRQE